MLKDGWQDGKVILFSFPRSSKLLHSLPSRHSHNPTIRDDMRVAIRGESVRVKPSTASLPYFIFHMLKKQPTSQHASDVSNAFSLLIRAG